MVSLRAERQRFAAYHPGGADRAAPAWTDALRKSRRRLQLERSARQSQEETIDPKQGREVEPLVAFSTLKRRSQKMNPATHATEGGATAPVLYMALELSNRTWRLALSDGAKRRQVAVPAADLLKLCEAVAKAKERFGMPASARVLSCYEAGRDGFWLHRHLVSLRVSCKRCMAQCMAWKRPPCMSLPT
jgi:hypothetical protein